LIRDIGKHIKKDPARAKEKQEVWNALTPQIQEDLKRFLKYDDLGKGKIYKKENNQ